MESIQGDLPKLPDMVMCGDHPSVTKTELNVRELKHDEKDKDKKERPVMSFGRISPSGSRTECERERERACARVPSERALAAARRRARSCDLLRPHLDLALSAPPNRALLQAALGSFRWPPYLVCVWVVVLLLTHALHCLVAALERALPPLKKLCLYIRTWTENSWRSEAGRGLTAALGLATGFVYTTYYALCAIHVLALWSVEPLCGDADDDAAAPAPAPGAPPRVTDYQDGATRSTTSVRH